MNSTKTLLLSSFFSAVIASVSVVGTGCTKEKDQVQLTEIEILVPDSVSEPLQLAAKLYNDSVDSLPSNLRGHLSLSPSDEITSARLIATGESKADGWIAAPGAVNQLSIDLVRGVGSTSTECVPLMNTHTVFAVTGEYAKEFTSEDKTFSWSELRAHISSGGEFYRGAQARPLLFYTLPEAYGEGMSQLVQRALVTKEQNVIHPILDEITTESESLVTQYLATQGTSTLRKLAADPTQRMVIITTKQRLAQYNNSIPTNSPSRLIPLTPREGAVVHDIALCISDAAWVTPAHRAILRQFSQLFSLPEVRTKIESQGFNALQNRDSALPTYKIPRNTTITALLRQWNTVKKPTATVFVIDTSATNNLALFEQWRTALKDILKSSSGNDQFALITTSTVGRIAAPFVESKERALEEVKALIPQSNAAIIDGIKKAFGELELIDASRFRRNIVVLGSGSAADSNDDLSALKSLFAANRDIFLHYYNFTPVGSAQNPLLTAQAIESVMAPFQLDYNHLTVQEFEEKRHNNPRLW